MMWKWSNGEGEQTVSAGNQAICKTSDSWASSPRYPVTTLNSNYPRLNSALFFLSSTHMYSLFSYPHPTPTAGNQVIVPPSLPQSYILLAKNPPPEYFFTPPLLCLPCFCLNSILNISYS